MKKMLPLLITGVILASCLMSGCGSEVKAYSDPQQTIDIGADGEFVILIALDSNPSTGYSWEAEYDETKLELVDETYEADAYADKKHCRRAAAPSFSASRRSKRATCEDNNVLQALMGDGSAGAKSFQRPR